MKRRPGPTCFKLIHPERRAPSRETAFEEITRVWSERVYQVRISSRNQPSLRLLYHDAVCEKFSVRTVFAQLAQIRVQLGNAIFDRQRKAPTLNRSNDQ
jgi:hypothetical protein